MINKISFAGRETMLDNGISKAAKKTYEYVSAAKIYTEKEIAAAKALNEVKESQKINEVYTSPFDTTGNRAVSIATSKDNAFSYAVSHGNPKPEGVGSKLDIER